MSIERHTSMHGNISQYAYLYTQTMCHVNNNVVQCTLENSLLEFIKSEVVHDVTCARCSKVCY